MKDTTFWPDSEQARRIGRSYKVDAAPRKLTAAPFDQLTYPLDDKTHGFRLPAWGLFWTASDVAKYRQMIPARADARQTGRFKGSDQGNDKSSRTGGGRKMIIAWAGHPTAGSGLESRRTTRWRSSRAPIGYLLYGPAGWAFRNAFRSHYYSNSGETGR
jgi:hypothetical protein